MQYNFIVAFGAVALSFQTMVLIKKEVELGAYTFLLFLACLLDYNLHRLIKFKYQNGSQNPEIFFRLKMLIGVLILGISINLFFISKALYMDLFYIGTLTILYTLPFVFKNKYINVIKKIPFLKTAMLAFVWTYLTLNIPIKLANTILDETEFIALFASRFFFISAITLPFDLRDKKTDLKDGVKSLAHILTVSQLNLLTYLSLGMMNAMMWIYLNKNQWSILCFAFLISSAILLVLTQSQKIKHNRYFYLVMLDGCLVLQFILVYLIAKI